MGNEGIDPLCPSESSLKVEYQLQPIDAKAEKKKDQDVLSGKRNTEDGCSDEYTKDKKSAGVQHP